MSAAQIAAAARHGRMWTSAQRFAAVAGAGYLLLGIAGFAVTGVHDFTAMHDDKVLVFTVNPLHNLFHLLMALVWLGAAPRPGTARIANFALAVVLAPVTLLGFVGAISVLATTGVSDSDNFLHLVTAILSLSYSSLMTGTRPAGAPAGAAETVPATELP